MSVGSATDTVHLTGSCGVTRGELRCIPARSRRVWVQSQNGPGMAPGEEPLSADTSGANLTRSLEKALDEAAGTGILNLSNRKLREFPRAASNYDLSDVIQADLSKNRLSEVPDEVCLYVSLELLNLYHNCVRTIPSSITNLQSLTYLNVSRCQLCALPAYLCCLPLKVLIASNNKLSSLPTDIGCFRQLRELDVSCNEIQRLPPEIGNLESLRDLNVRRNQLDRLPEEIAELPLVRLDFSCNKVTHIPVCYRHLRHLQTILLDNNPLQSPPAQVCTKGKIHIFKYLNIEACKIVPDLSDLDRAMRPPGFSSSLSDEICPSRQPSGLDSGFHSVDSGSKRWSGNELTDEFSDLSLRMGEFSREQRLLRESQPTRRMENGTTGDQDFDFIIDSSLNGEGEEVRRDQSTPRNCHTHTHQDQDKVLSQNSPDKGPSEEWSGARTEGSRDGEERRRPETLQIWQEREKQNQHRPAERHDRGASISSTGKLSTTQSELGSRTSTGGFIRTSTEPPSPRKADVQLYTDAWSAVTPASRPDGDRAPQPSSDTPTSESGALHKPSSFLFRSSTRTNLRSSSAMSPVSPVSPTQIFPEPPLDTKPVGRLRSPEQAANEEEQIAQLRKSIESRLKQTLPEDLGEALNNGVMLCQLVNHLRPRFISIIHIPSPAVPKLSLAKSRRNVESFLEACRKMGVPQDILCESQHILEEDGLLRVAETVRHLELAARRKPVRLAEGE
ncbi:leucine-rich repeat and calponin homology domain-containing protein 4 isoform X2 [Hypanus sabinus]|uniref:leucine-rich repeat and calponin homology domain-containing protein 4 isoform X2 n=1 Tax=Hypanus sabinus TaxID=79690 RepID=UPI0028C3B9E1|nr:leucine-rich repeat and calponin homology domain-containing protein 4 isoform X2 [Hypanus sabinus]